MITIFGTSLGPTAPVQLALDSTGKVSTNIGNVLVLVNGFACPLIYVSSTQISAVVPYEVSPYLTAQIYVKFLGASSNGIEESVATTGPGIFTANSSGTGPGAILNPDYSLNSPSNPAAKGSVVTLTSPAKVRPARLESLATLPKHWQRRPTLRLPFYRWPC